MECSEARGTLWPPERPRLVGGDVAAAREHVEVCEACRDYLAQDRALLDLYDRARSVRAPVELRERVFDALAGARWGALQPAPSTTPLAGETSFSAQIRRLAIPAMILVVVAGGTILQVRTQPDAREEAEMFVEDYLRRAVGQDHIETDDPSEVTRFLERELGLRFAPIQLAGLELSRAEICLLEGRRGAMIVYKKDGAEVAHYIVPREDSAERDPALSTSGRAEAGRMPVVTWATPDIEQALVGEVEADELLRIARRGRS